MEKKNLTNEEVLSGNGINYIRQILSEKEKDSGTFWYPRCVELLGIYKDIINEHPEDIEEMTLDDIVIAFARHAYYYAFNQRQDIKYIKNMEKKKILLLIDCQVDFITGSLANPDAQACIPRILNKIKEFDGDAIFLTMDTHQKNYLETAEGKKLPVEHCIYGTNGWGIEEKIRNAVEARELLGMEVQYITKPTFGSVEPTFGSEKSLIELILNTELKAARGETQKIPMEIEVCGFCTDICVCSNVLILKAFTYDFAEITVDSKCCAGITPEKHEAALEVMKSCQINVI